MWAVKILSNMVSANRVIINGWMWGGGGVVSVARERETLLDRRNSNRSDIVTQNFQLNRVGGCKKVFV